MHDYLNCAKTVKRIQGFCALCMQ